MFKNGFEYEDQITQSTTSVKPVVIEGGLDYTTAKSLVKPGSLLDCENYEIVDRAGIRTGGSYFRWDGSQDINSEQIFFLACTNSASPISTTANMAGRMLYSVEVATKAGKNYPFGVVIAVKQVSSTEKYVYYFRIDSRYEPRSGDTIRALDVAAGTFEFLSGTTPAPIENQSTFDTSYYTPGFSSETTLSPRNLSGYIHKFFNDFYYNYYNGPSAFFSCGQSTPLFRSNPSLNIVGVEYFNDKAYAIADLHQLAIDRLGTQPYPGDFVLNAATGYIFQVLDVNLIAGSWGGGTTAHRAILMVKDVNTPKIVAGGTANRLGFSPGPLPGNSAVTWTLLRDGTTVGKTYAGSDLTTFFDIYPATQAGLYRSFTEKQAWDEGMLSTITVTSGGSGYDTPPVISFTGGGGTGAVAVAYVSGGSVSNIVLVDPGRGYTSAPTVVITPASGDVGIVAATATATVADYTMAGMRFIDTGWVVNYNKGNSASNRLNVIDRRKAAAGQTTTLTTGTTDITDATITGNGKPQYVAALQFDGSSTSSRGWGSISPTGVQSNADGTAGPNCSLNSTFANNDYRTTTLTFSQFKNTLPSIAIGSVIKGFEVVMDYDVVAGTQFPTAVNSFKVRMCLVKLKPNPANPNLPLVERITPFRESSLATPTTTLNTSVTVGGSTDLWGLSGTTIDSLTADGADIGVALDIYINKVDAFDMGFVVDKLTLAVTYSSPSVTYYFADTTTVAQRNVIAADLVNYQIEKGKFSTGDAQGVMQIAGLRYIELYNSGQKHNIRSGWKVYADSALSVQVAEVTADMTYNGLDSRKDLVDNDSRYQIISANFYADEEWEAIYGVSGAGRAWYFDGVYFARIYAIPLSEPNSATKDIPRHIAFYRYHLALGYKPGTVQFSVLGEPENFSGLDGASSHAPGDRVTGMAALPGAYLAVFCENSIWGIYGTVVSEFELKTIVPNSGAIEYTVQTLGARPVYTNSFGIYYLDQVQEYGDFKGFSLSDNVTSKLLPRLQKVGSQYDSSTAGSILFSYIVRSKNQYRLWFKDGRQLVMSLVGSENTPEFTWLNTQLPRIQTPFATGTPIPFVPLALTSRVDKFGVERILAAPYMTPLETTYCSSMLFQMDKFWGWDDGVQVHALPAFATINYVFNDNPTVEFTLSRIRVEGQTRNIGDLSVSTSGPYDEDGFTNPQPLNLGGTDDGIPLDYFAHSDKADVAEEGRCILIKFENYSTNNQDSNETTFNVTKYAQPPHYIQLLFLTTEQGKEDA